MHHKLTLLLKLEFKVNLSVSNFYQWFCDLNNYSKIFPHVHEIKPVNEGLITPGSEFIEYAKNFYGKREKLKVKILKVKKEEEIWVEVDNPRTRSLFCFTFKEFGKQTLFTVNFFSGHQNPLRLLFLKTGMHLLFLPRKINAQKRMNNLFPPKE